MRFKSCVTSFCIKNLEQEMVMKSLLFIDQEMKNRETSYRYKIIFI